jgi:hypothetical protein
MRALAGSLSAIQRMSIPGTQVMFAPLRWEGRRGRGPRRRSRIVRRLRPRRGAGCSLHRGWLSAHCLARASGPNLGARAVAVPGSARKHSGPSFVLGWDLFLEEVRGPKLNQHLVFNCEVHRLQVL